MILDDLFNFAAQNYKPPSNVVVSAVVLTNWTDGLQGRNQGYSYTEPPLTLVYIPRHKTHTGFSPPSFQSAPGSSQGLTITAPRPLVRGALYWIEYQGYGSAAAVGFAAAVDATTNIIYGAAGQQFVTIGLCGEWVPP